MKNIVKFNKDGSARLNCKITDETFLHYLGMVFSACVEKWGISYADFSKLVSKFSLPQYIYNNYLVLCNYGMPTVVEAIENHINLRG